MNSRSESYKTPIHHMHFCPSMFQHLQPRPAQTTDAGAPRCVVSQVSWPREIAWQPTELRWPQGQMDMDLFVGKRDFVPPRQKGAFVVSGWLLDRNVFFSVTTKLLHLQEGQVSKPKKTKMCLMLNYRNFQNVQSISTCNVHSVPWWEVSDLAVVLATCPPRRSTKNSAGRGEVLVVVSWETPLFRSGALKKHEKGWIHYSSPNLMIGGFQSCWGFQGGVTRLRSGERIFPVLIAGLLGKAAIFGKGLT